MGVRRRPPVDPAGAAAHRAAARAAPVNPIRRMMGSIVAELLPVRPYPLDMSTWTMRGHGRILTRMLAEIPG